MTTDNPLTDFQQRRKDIDSRSAEDFDFMVLCESMQNRGMYRLLRDATVDADRARLDADEAFFGLR